MNKYILLFTLIGFFSCGDEEPGNNMSSSMPEITISSSFGSERDETFDLTIEISLSEASDVQVSVDYSTVSKTATGGIDFVESSGTIEVPPGQLIQSFTVSILDDDDTEIEEYFLVNLDNAKNATINRGRAVITIADTDKAQNDEGEGYVTAKDQDGYDLVWSDEFDGDMLDESSWTYEIGDGCDKNLCGWGNNELQDYSSDPENIFLKDGILTINAEKKIAGSYTSARIITQDKREYKFGRIDIRAKLPKGQGLWPAIWMLGANINETAWPACGEIDVMEMVGHEPKKTHGTAHWGNVGEGSQYRGSSFSLNEDFADRYHVFTLLWKNNSLQWYVDETLFYTLTNNDTQGFVYPFNAEFFFIMNVAIGGNWPGSPDETTVFPQKMEVDYIRVFQEV